MSTNRQRRDPEATRQSILDAAQKLFVERGPKDVSTSEIAREADVTKSLIHHHFGSKESLWEEVKVRHFRSYFEAQKQMLDAVPVGTLELLHRSMETYFRFLQRHPESVRFKIWRSADDEGVCLPEEEELFDLGVRRVREAQEAGEVRADIEPIHAIKAFLSLIQNYFETRSLFCHLLGARFVDADMDERYLRDVVGIFLDGVRARPASAPSSTSDSDSPETSR